MNSLNIGYWFLMIGAAFGWLTFIVLAIIGIVTVFSKVKRYIDRKKFKKHFNIPADARIMPLGDTTVELIAPKIHNKRHFSFWPPRQPTKPPMPEVSKPKEEDK